LAAFPRHVRLVAGVRCDALYEYTGLARSVVLGYKVHCRTRLARTIGPPLGALVRAATDAAPSGALVLRVPSSRSGALRRGFDPVTLALRHGGLRADGVLRRTRGGDSSGQKSRTAIERVAATVGSLRAHGVRGRAVILVDDVVTTGTTMAEAVRAVRAAGGSVVRCVALAGVEQ
jgi:predicted amidophosphoribosyltransferase